MKSILKNLIIATLITGLITYCCNVDFLGTNNFNMITVNTVLVGFLFTIYTILMSFINEEVIETYESMDEMDKIYNNITIGIIFGILATGVAIFSLCVWGEPKDIIPAKAKIAYSFEIALFILIMKSMLLAIIDINCIIGAIRDKKRKEIKKKIADKKMEEEFK